MALLIPPALDFTRAQILDPPRHNWMLLFTDSAGLPVDLPRADVESISAEDVVNMGSGQAEIVVRRDPNNIGAIAYGYYVMLWFWTSRTLFDRGAGGGTRPALPYWWGRIVDIDTEKLTTEGKVTVHLDGVGKDLDRAIVTEEINPDVAGNPSMTATTYLTYLLTTYQPPWFSAPVVPPTMFNLKPNKFDGTKLGKCLDTLLKQGRDAHGLLYTWTVRPNFEHNDGRLSAPRPQVVIQPDQDPNTLPGATFKHIFVGAQAIDYKISTKYRDIVNVAAFYGGRDPVTGFQVYAPAEDVASQTAFGPIEDKVSVDYIDDAAGLAEYATTYFDLHAFPQAQGTCEMALPDHDVVAGSWVQFWELIGPSSSASIIKQVRISMVKIDISSGRVKQVLTPVSPTPYLDEAIYRMGWHLSAISKTQQAATQSPWGAQVSFIRSGIQPSGTRVNGNPWTLPLSAGEVVFNGVAYPVGLSSVGAIDDGFYVVSVFLSGGSALVRLTNVTATKGKTIPPETTTSLNVLSLVVVNGIIYA